MTQAVDFVLYVMRRLSPSEPVLFQRNGSLFVASPEGFGQVTYGLCTKPETIQPWEQRKQPPAIAESEDVIKRCVGKWNEKPVFLGREQEYFASIAYGPDSISFSLKEMAETAQRLAELPDDGKIRMVRHGSSHHSHKYGYANDGIDVWVEEARVMDRERYLELVREREDEIITEMKNMHVPEGERDIHSLYLKSGFPDCAILTPNMMVSLPRRVKLDVRGDEPQSWTQYTMLRQNHDGYNRGGILNCECPNLSGKSPFAVAVTLNAQNLTADIDGEGLHQTRSRVLSCIERELDAVEEYLPIASGFVGRMNTAHDKLSMRIEKLRRKKVVA